IDWCGSELIVDGDNSSNFTRTAFVVLLDSGNSSMRNYIFDDRNFSFSGPSRGCTPVFIENITENTSGYTFGPFFIRRGQSLVTAYSANGAYKAKTIRFVGACEGDQCYYGVNLANNGDDFKGSCQIGRANRIFIGYGVSNFDLDFFLVEGDPTSAHIAIGNTGSGYPATANGRVRGHIGTINGPIVLADQPQAAGTGEYYNIEVDVSFDALGENITEADPIIRVGAYLPNGLLDTSERTIKADNITFNVNKGHGIGLLDNPIKIFTP